MIRKIIKAYKILKLKRKAAYFEDRRAFYALKDDKVLSVLYRGFAEEMREEIRNLTMNKKYIADEDLQIEIEHFQRRIKNLKDK